jgi:hypothetical protein
MTFIFICHAEFISASDFRRFRITFRQAHRPSGMINSLLSLRFVFLTIPESHQVFKKKPFAVFTLKGFIIYNYSNSLLVTDRCTPPPVPVACWIWIICSKFVFHLICKIIHFLSKCQMLNSFCCNCINLLFG